MKKMKLWSLGNLALLLMVGVSLYAQQSTPPTTSTDPNAAPQSQPTQPTDPTGQQPAPPPQGQPNQTPNQGSQAAPDSQSQPTTSTSDTQTFVGTIVKSGDKYMLQDAASGKSYDIDHQDQVKQYEGKKVRVHGTLDASANMIHLQ
jgi:cytoskeletal protein RodZ